MKTINAFNPSPKAQLLSSKALMEAYWELMENQALQTILDLSLKSYSKSLSGPVSSPEEAVGRFHRIAGATDLLDVIRSIGVQQQVSQQPSMNLNHSA